MIDTTPRICPDCGATPTQPHLAGCDIPLCLHTGRPRTSCPGGIGALHDCGNQTWTGLLPGVLEALEHGMLCRPAPGEHVVRCTAEHPDATPDWNRLATECRWNPATGRLEPGQCEHPRMDLHIAIEDDHPWVILQCTTCPAMFADYELGEFPLDRLRDGQIVRDPDVVAERPA